MGRVIGKREIVFQGNEVEVNYTCCQHAKWEIENLRESFKKLATMREIINPPVYFGNTEIKIVGLVDNSFKLNYCPICGEKYGKEK
jgi:hypothetical protein